MKDAEGRGIEYLRISITEQCNLHCRYCRPEGCFEKPERWQMTLEDILRVGRAAGELGLRYIKITGGEPLLRRDCGDIIRQLKQIPGIERVTLTTNGLTLGKWLLELAEAGVDSINVSLDTLDPEAYRELTGADSCAEVKQAIQKAVHMGLSVKVNSVLMKGREDWRQLMLLARDLPVDVRFIEMMPMGEGRIFETEDYRKVLKAIWKMYPEMKLDESIHGPGPAIYYQIPGFQGSLGFIGAIHGQFCDRCNRIRLTSDGHLKACLCYPSGADIQPALIRKADAEIKKQMQAVIEKKPASHCFDAPEAIGEKRRMSEIGG